MMGYSRTSGIQVRFLYLSIRILSTNFRDRIDINDSRFDYKIQEL